MFWLAIVHIQARAACPSSDVLCGTEVANELHSVARVAAIVRRYDRPVAQEGSSAMVMLGQTCASADVVRLEPHVRRCCQLISMSS